MIGDFVAANPGLQPGMISLSCGNRRDRGRLQELRDLFRPRRRLHRLRTQ